MDVNIIFRCVLKPSSEHCSATNQSQLAIKGYQTTDRKEDPRQSLGVGFPDWKLERDLIAHKYDRCLFGLEGSILSNTFRLPIRIIESTEMCAIQFGEQRSCMRTRRQKELCTVRVDNGTRVGGIRLKLYCWHNTCTQNTRQLTNKKQKKKRLCKIDFGNFRISHFSRPE